MDFNYLYHRRHVSLMRGAAATCEASRAAHEGLAQLYGSVIDSGRAERQTRARLATARSGATALAGRA
jgi:hypothetical protein